MVLFQPSVRLRLTMWYAGVLALALALFALSVYLFVVRTLQSNIDQVLEGYGQKINQVAVRHISGKHLDVGHVPVPAAAHGPFDALLIMNIQNDAKIITRGHTQPAYNVLRIALHRNTQNCNTITAGSIDHKVLPLRYCIRLVYRKGKPVGGVEVLASLVGVNKALERLRIALLLGIPFALLLTGAGGWLLAGRALQPVNSITSMAQSITATDLSRRINLRRRDELGRLAGTFDDMIGRLERAFQEQRQLAADVSHELRSPLTILEAQTTLALRRPRPPEEYRSILVSIQEEVEHMSGMVNQLMMLARAEAGEEQITLEPLQLARVVQQGIAGMLPVAAQEGVDLRLHVAGSVWIEGDSSRLRQLLTNLLDNAVQHTQPEGRIDVMLAEQGGEAVLTVRDNGVGISPEDLPHIFQRFYRGDRARQRITGNSGLGLAIVRWIVEAHGGTIAVQSEVGCGTTFCLRFPLCMTPLEV